MSDAQKLVLGWLGIAVLVAAAVSTVFLVIQLQNGNYLNRTDIENVRLSFLWRQAVTIIKLGTVASIVFASVLAIINVSVGVVAKTYNRSIQILALLVVCSVGIISAFIIIGEIDPVSGAANDIRFYGGFVEDEIGVSEKIGAFAYSLIGWFATYALAILGLSTTIKGAVVERIVERLKGG